MEGLGVVGERDGVNLGKNKITTGRSDDQPRGPGTALHGMVQTISTCFETDIHSPMNKRGTMKIISVVYGASVQRRTAAVMACRKESGGMVQTEEVSMRSLDIQESDMVTWVDAVDLGGAHSGSFMGAACLVMEVRARLSNSGEKGSARKRRAVSSSGGSRKWSRLAHKPRDKPSVPWQIITSPGTCTTSSLHPMFSSRSLMSRISEWRAGLVELPERRM